MVRQPRFRGKDFEGKWSLGAWAEAHIIDAVGRTGEFVAFPYGRSEVGPEERARQKEHWSRHREIEAYGKRPDLLVFDRRTYEGFQLDPGSDEMLNQLERLPEDEVEDIVRSAVTSVEAEASIWQAEKMPHYGRDWWRGEGRKKPVRELAGWTAPTIIVKDEDFEPLQSWQNAYGLPIHVVHVFYDLAFMLRFDRLKGLIEEGEVELEPQRYGAASKEIFKVFYGLAEPFGEFVELSEVTSFSYQTNSGKFKSDPCFEGGRLDMAEGAVESWHALASPE